MKTFITMILFAVASATYAACTTNTIFRADGSMVICTTCCSQDGRNCTTTCI
jgi:hypothetical protein